MEKKWLDIENTKIRTEDSYIKIMGRRTHEIKLAAANLAVARKTGLILNLSAIL
tara:strand:- start:216 stop:377 length:162 start_codon:yes stop_codon:yes gene_type:complete